MAMHTFNFQLIKRPTAIRDWSQGLKNFAKNKAKKGGFIQKPPF